MEEIKTGKISCRWFTKNQPCGKFKMLNILNKNLTKLIAQHILTYEDTKEPFFRTKKQLPIK
ncbi:MAG: hypothetical protein EA344_09210 [Alkalicoccus sp.]|nr:MAG: hypothetical protein EA344_09210 [Alkalicoccus sp.]